MAFGLFHRKSPFPAIKTIQHDVYLKHESEHVGTSKFLMCMRVEYLINTFSYIILNKPALTTTCFNQK
jgi:hypothetical protein